MTACRTANSQAEEERPRRRREATTHGIHGRPAGSTQARVRRQQVPDRGTPSVAGQRTAAQRVTDQDLVSEQTRQDEEGERRAQPVGVAADGSRTLQSFVSRTALTHDDNTAAAAAARGVVNINKEINK